MDQQSSNRWLETLKRERRAKEKWNAKFLTPQEQQAEREEAERELAEETLARQNAPPKHMSEKDAMLRRLAALEMDYNEENEPPKPKPRPASASYAAARARAAEQVKADRIRNHRLTGDLSTPSLLHDISPTLSASFNPAYVYARPTSSAQAVHVFDRKKGWAAPVDKTHHLKQDAFMAHADKCLQLGELPFVSGGMKLSGK